MIVILSPSKTLEKIDAKVEPKGTQPQFIDKSKELVERLRKLNVNDIEELMSVSPKLARLNFERFLKWQTPFTQKNSTPALLFFKGDVYEGISADDYTNDDFKFAQEHVRILSGLYGVLRPLDLMQPYRLEMGTKIEVGSNVNLYEFWKEELTKHFNKLLKDDAESTLVNLASNEYSKALNLKKIDGNVITPIFKEQKGNTYKTVAIHAKRARGVMTRFIVKNRIEKVEHLKSFTEEGYVFSPEQSKENDWVFIR
ncbi:MAG: peroxide stress protein YaaA [Bacteroidales bacterium]